MANFITLLIRQSHVRLLGFVLWFATFVLTLIAATGLFVYEVNQTMMSEARVAIDPHIRLRQGVTNTIGEMQRRLTAEPCSPQFHAQLRDIAFLPDGLNEFLYAPGGVARCSVDLDFAPYDLGAPDSRPGSNGAMVWYARPLDFVGRPGVRGDIALFGDFAVIVPTQNAPMLKTEWLDYEVVSVTSTGSYWHKNGKPGVYATARQAGAWADVLPLANGAFAYIQRPSVGDISVAVTGKFSAILAANVSNIALAIAICAVIALGISGQIHSFLRRFWSFDARFRRHFDRDSIICAYQPILSLASGNISGCEVLVRWRDVDGSTVFPDQFLPAIEKYGLGRDLTRYVADRAFEELSSRLPPHLKLQVNFNIFPADLDAKWLRDVFARFEDLPERFSVVIEIIESDQLEADRAQREIEALRRYGIKTYLDDFGTGYSNIQNLATLALEGVKLDRSFAMSPDGSLMSRMLLHTIEMIHSAGHRITVEGVESEERLQLIKATEQVDFIQGYLISRPIDIDRFVEFLTQLGTPAARRPRLVA